MKKKRFLSGIIGIMTAAALLSGCAASDTLSRDTGSSDASDISVLSNESGTPAVGADGIARNTGRALTIGFIQVGAESDWRMASTASIENAFSSENGYHLITNDAQQKQENEIKAIRELIDQDVDYILFSPITETGWESSLQEAKEAGIPVIMFDRTVNVADKSLYTAWIGSDFLLEGRRACAWLKAWCDLNNVTGNVNIVDIQGTIDSSAQIGRTKALKEAVQANGNWKLLGAESGDFTSAKGQEVMEEMLDQYGSEINVVYCENDNEAYGAITAIRESGRKIGNDITGGEIMILSFDSTKEGMTDTLNGLISVNTECNPLYGPILTQMVQKLEKGEELTHETFIDEDQFSALPDIAEVMAGGVTYPVINLTQAVLDNRKY